MADIWVGIGGWDFAGWRGSFYARGLPRARQLAFASRKLTSIEINGTFYRHQTPKIFAAWRDETPEGFVFAVKAHRATTQGRNFAGAETAIPHFLDSGLAELGPKLGPILWQFPPQRRFDAAACGAFLSLLPKSLGRRRLRHAVEAARHPSFQDPAWIALLRRHKVAAVIVDSHKQALRGDLTAGFVYARLQLNEAGAPEGYASEALDRWAERFGTWAKGGMVTDLPVTESEGPLKQKPLDCFCYFIGGDKERAPDAAQAMLARLSGKKV
jgi:uncharacterized protein YecE (DUF72 family)